MKKLFIFLCFSILATAQPMPTEQKPSPKETQPKAPEKIEIKPTARDHEIQERLSAILNATGWFVQPQIQVKEGVVFLNGEAETEEFKKWAGELARNTQDVSAVVNKMKISKPSIWDFRPIWSGLQELWRDLVTFLPSFAFALLILVFTWLIAKLVIWISRKIFQSRITSPLLREVMARIIGFFVFLMGFYIIFKMLGLTTVAFTIIGGTGLLGIILGIAFRDITENLLASIFLSIHQPFQNGDLVEITGIQGYVQRLTIRSTILMALDGNHVQIPNATVYKSNILNYSANPNRMETFNVTIGYNEGIPEAQEIALKVLAEHPVVLKDPEPWVLVDSLEKATVTLRIYFWLNGDEHSWLKVRSSVMRLIKRAFQKADISMPGEARDLYFPEEIPIRIVEAEKKKIIPEREKVTEEPASIATTSEAGLSSESKDIQEQARLSRTPEKGEENLLDSKDS